jgi:hypothetical protein
MEINEFEDVLGVIPTEDIVEGRFVLLCAQGFTYDFGSLEDLPGVKLPDNIVESCKARFILTWKVDNRPTPIYAVPSYPFAMRGGWNQAPNAPFSTTVYLTHPGNQNCLTIASGVSSLAYTEGTFTVYSGCYIDSPQIRVVGANVAIANTADDSAPEAGMPKYGGAGPGLASIAETYRYDSTPGALTIRIK